MAKVYEVLDVSVAFNKKLPPEFLVSANGNARTSGWTQPRLVPYVYVNPPADGVQEYDFEATKPDGVVLQVITPIAATEVWPDPPKWLRGARVYSETNSEESLLGKRP